MLAHCPFKDTAEETKVAFDLAYLIKLFARFSIKNDFLDLATMYDIVPSSYSH